MQIQKDFKTSFCWRYYLTKEDVISGYAFLRPGLKTGMDFRGQFLKWVWKVTFFGLKSNGVRIWRTGRHTPTRIPRGIPSPRSIFHLTNFQRITTA